MELAKDIRTSQILFLVAPNGHKREHTLEVVEISEVFFFYHKRNLHVVCILFHFLMFILI